MGGANLRLELFVDNLEGARLMEYAPNGDLFVSQPSANSITVLRDTNNDGTPDTRNVYVQGPAPARRGGPPPAPAAGAPGAARGGAAAAPPGDIVRIPFADPGNAEHIGGGQLPFPGGIAQGGDGAIYTSVFSAGTTVANGAVMRVASG